jgi:hypothetical protein
MNPFPLKKISIRPDRFWELPKEKRSAILLLGLFLNEINCLMRVLAKAGQGLPPEPGQPRLTPEQEAGEALVATLITTLVGKTFEGWESLTDKKGTPQSILEKLPLSDATKQLQWELEHKLSDGIFARVRNVVGFHYSKTLIKIDHLKGTITDIDSHLFLHPEAAMGFTLSRLSTLALFETLLRLVSASTNRVEAINEMMRKVFDTLGLYSTFITAALSDLLKAEFHPLAVNDVVIPDAPAIDDQTQVLYFYVHAPEGSDW